MPLGAYGAEAGGLLAPARALFAADPESFVERFYAAVERAASLRGNATWSRPEPGDPIRAQLACHLATLLDPSLTEEVVLSRAREAGTVHAIAGVDAAWYGEAVSDFVRAVEQGLGVRAPRRRALEARTVLGRRLTDALYGALLGFRDVEAAHADAAMAVGQVASCAETVADLVRGVLEALRVLPGVAAAYFGRPDGEGHLQFEFGSGTGADAFLAGGGEPAVPPMSTFGDVTLGLGPAGRAWRSGEVRRSDAYHADPATAPWREVAKRFGFRSSAAVPLADATGRSRALLSLYSLATGYFASASCQALLGHLKLVTERALVRLESRPVPASAVRSRAERAAHIEHLAAGDVVMLYQPVVELATGRLLKLEALARLRSDGDLLSPAAFLPSFGEEELLGLFAAGLDRALSALGGWEREGLCTGVSLNLPARSSIDARYADLVDRALDRHGVAAGRLTLELLESGALEGDDDQHVRVLQRLRASGVRLAEDDLGAGHSSLLRLRSIDFDEVKVDRELIRGAEAVPLDALSFIEPLTHLAHCIGLTVVIEGLETRGLIEAAAFLGADAGQGFAIARPLDGRAVPGWARSFRLDLDARLPGTDLGGLAAHLAWENRLRALPHASELWRLAASDACVLTRYLEGRGETAFRAEAAHRNLHAVVLEAPGTEAHRKAWGVLAEQLDRLRPSPAGP